MWTSRNSAPDGDGNRSDFRNQRASAISIDVGSERIECAHLADSGEGLQTLQQFRRLLAEMKAQRKPPGMELFNPPGVPRRSLSMINNGEALAERVGFFHVVRRQKDGFAELVIARQPQEFPARCPQRISCSMASPAR